MGDEGLNPYLPGERLAEITGRPLNGDVETAQLYPKVLEKYDVYHIYVDHRNGRNESFIRTWKELMDDEHFRVVKLNAIADMIIRIVTARAEEDKRTTAVIAPVQEEISW